jgi:hypothetical protein
MRGLAVAALLLAPSVAHADRDASFSVTGGVEGTFGGMDSVFGATLSWDRPPPAFPAHDTARVRGDLVPEVMFMAFGDRGSALAGVRLELDFTQSRMGHARSSLSLVPRIGLFADADSAIGGGDFAARFYLGESRWHVGLQLGLYTWNEGGEWSTTFTDEDGDGAPDERRTWYPRHRGLIMAGLFVGN